jgi:hypothetical protein
MSAKLTPRQKESNMSLNFMIGCLKKVVDAAVSEVLPTDTGKCVCSSGHSETNKDVVRNKIASLKSFCLGWMSGSKVIGNLSIEGDKKTANINFDSISADKDKVLEGLNVLLSCIDASTSIAASGVAVYSNDWGVSYTCTLTPDTKGN